MTADTTGRVGEKQSETEHHCSRCLYLFIEALKNVLFCHSESISHSMMGIYLYLLFVLCTINCILTLINPCDITCCKCWYILCLSNAILEHIWRQINGISSQHMCWAPVFETAVKNEVQIETSSLMDTSIQHRVSLTKLMGCRQNWFTSSLRQSDETMSNLLWPEESEYDCHPEQNDTLFWLQISQQNYSTMFALVLLNCST